MNMQKEYEKFLERNPEYITKIQSYEFTNDKAIKMQLSDGKTAWYYPATVKEAENYYKKHDKHR